MTEGTSHATVSDATSPTKVRLVASSGDITLQKHHQSYTTDAKQIAGYFEHAQWTADGTTILTSSSSHTITGYVVPENLLEPKAAPLTLKPHTTIALGEATNVLASAPYYNISEPYTNQLLVSSRDHPVQLFYLFPPSSDGSRLASHSPAASYPLTKARSETFLSATSLVWPSPGSYFMTGCSNLLAKFDISRPGEEPVLRVKTIPSERHLSKGGGVGMRGTISTLSVQPPAENHSSLVAAGTWTRWVGLYDFAQAGACVSAWSIKSASDETETSSGNGIKGDGVMHTTWSPCGRYLLVSERKSRGILVYDVRVTGQLLAWLENREALGNQRIDCDVFSGQEGFEVWSGNTDGTVKVWEDVGRHQGAQEPAWVWQAHKSTVGSTRLHPTGTVIATCSGSWEFPEGQEPEPSLGQNDGIHSLSWMHRRNRESSLKIWSLDSSDGYPDDTIGVDI